VGGVCGGGLGDVLAERVIVSIGEVIFDLVSVPACDFEGKTKRQRGIDDYLVCSPSIISTIVVHVVKLDLEKMKNEIWEDSALKKCPSWVRASLSNHSGAKLDEIHRHFVLWAFMCPDGKPRVWEQLDESTRQSYCSEKTGNHYWLRLTNSHSHFGVVDEQTYTQVWEITSSAFS